MFVFSLKSQGEGEGEGEEDISRPALPNLISDQRKNIN